MCVSTGRCSWRLPSRTPGAISGELRRASSFPKRDLDLRGEIPAARLLFHRDAAKEKAASREAALAVGDGVRPTSLGRNLGWSRRRACAGPETGRLGRPSRRSRRAGEFGPPEDPTAAPGAGARSEAVRYVLGRDAGAGLVTGTLGGTRAPRGTGKSFSASRSGGRAGRRWRSGQCPDDRRRSRPSGAAPRRRG